ncbi:hypothetical protein P7C70_g5762, partial [Phenoliferia sp. Uapishka_3]
MSLAITPRQLPGEIVADIIRSALATLPPTDPNNHARRDLLLSLSLVSHIWAEEAQRILFLTESVLDASWRIRSWCLAARRYALTAVAVRKPWAVSPDPTCPTLQDVQNLLDAVGSQLLHLELEVGWIAGDVLHHPVLRGLESLSLSFEDYHIPASTPAPLLGNLEFSLTSLRISIDFDPSEGNFSIPVEVMKALEPAVRRATTIEIENHCGEQPEDEEALAVAVANLIGAASRTLQTLSLTTDHHPQINHSLRGLLALQQIRDDSRGYRQEKVDRICALPNTIKRYYPMGNDHDDIGALVQAIAVVILEDDTALPNLEEIGGKWVLDHPLLEIVGEQVVARRPNVRFVNARW